MAGSEIAPPIGPLEPVELTGRPAIAQHAKILALIAAELGAADAALFGRPRLGPDGTALGWHGAGDRPLRPLDSLDPAARDAQGARMAAVRGRVGALADRLEQRGDAGRVAAHLLRAAVVTPLGVPAIYSDGQDPVLLFWGAARPGQPRPVLTLTPPPPPPPPPPPVEPVMADPAAPLPAAARAGVNWLWGVPLVLLAGFGYFTWVAVRPLDPVIVDVTPPAAQTPNPLPGLSAELADLRRTLAEIQRAEGDLAQLCLPLPPAAPPPAPKPAEPPRAETPAPPPAVAETPAPAETPPPTAEPQQTVETTPLPEAKPAPIKPAKPVPVKPTPEPPATADVTPVKPPKPVPVKPQPEPPATAEVTPVKPPKPVPVKPTPAQPEVAIQAEPPASPAPSAACTPTWSPGKQPRVVFVLDGSGSMSDSLGGGGTRIGAAKSAIGQVVRGLHRDIRAALVSFSACGSTQRSEFYGYEDRPTLLGQVGAVRPQQGTSLAASIKRAGNSASSRAPTTVVVVSDGEDTCGGDPCAEARAARAAKPNLTINVIDLSGGGGGGTLACVASAGGGRVFTPRSAGQMAAQLQRATGQPDASGCN